MPWPSTRTMVLKGLHMRSKQELIARADYLVGMIRKHGGWLGGDGETVHFPSVAERHAFDAEIESDKYDGFDWKRFTKQLEG